MLKTKHAVQIALLALSAATMHAALAHGAAKPRHGGVVQMAHDLSFELVAEEGGAAIYLIDHDQPLSSQGISGRLTVLQGAQKSEADLQPAGGNKLSAKGVKIASGAKVVAVLDQVEGRTATVRFSVK